MQIKKFAKYIFFPSTSLLFIEKRFNYVSCYSFSMFILKHLLQFQHLCVCFLSFLIFFFVSSLLLLHFIFLIFSLVSLFFLLFHYINFVSHSYSSMCSNFRTTTEFDPTNVRARTQRDDVANETGKLQNNE